MAEKEKPEIDLNRFIWNPGDFEILPSKESKSIIEKDDKIKKEIMEKEQKSK